jgi:hypothetical protein
VGPDLRVPVLGGVAVRRSHMDETNGTTYSAYRYGHLGRRRIEEEGPDG